MNFYLKNLTLIEENPLNNNILHNNKNRNQDDFQLIYNPNTYEITKLNFNKEDKENEFFFIFTFAKKFN